MARRYSRKSEKVIRERLRKQIMALILIPLALLGALVFFGPQIGQIYGLLSGTSEQTEGDTIAPPAPIFRDAPEWVNETNIRLEGFAESGTTVKLFVNGPEQQSTVATNDGTFEFENVELITGRNTIFAKAFDQEGNESEKSRTLTIETDNDSPEIELETPKDGDTVKNLNERVLVRGTIDEKATVRINGKLAIVKPDLTFERTIGVEEGDVKIEIEAIDEAGNSSKVVISIIYDKTSD